MNRAAERKHTILSPEEMGTGLTATTVEDGCFPVRRLQITDKSKGFISLLGQLTVCDSISDEQFEARFQDLTSSGDDHVICVIEDEHSGRIIATGTIFIEKKFIRNCGKVGHIEDVVVDSSVRGKRLGQKIIQFLSDHAQALGCYKVILDCSIENKRFYEKCGFKQKEIQMVRYFN
ncbi:Glucosamine-phosphate N-acetyltransferase-like protein [Asimina triloba]